AIVQAIAAEQMPLDERCLPPQTRRSQRRNNACRATPDRHQVIATRRPWVGPVRRMRMGHQLPVVLVVRSDVDAHARLGGLPCNGNNRNRRRPSLASARISTTSESRAETTADHADLRRQNRTLREHNAYLLSAQI